MKKNVCKWLSAALAVCLLAAMLPLGGITVTAAVNMISNGTFENGTSSWGKSTNTVMSTEAGITGNSLKATHADNWAYVYTTARGLTANTDYIISFNAKADKGGFKVNFSDTSWNSVASEIPSLAPAITTSWQSFTMEFNSAQYTSLLLFFQSNQYGSAAQTIWLDDVKVTAKTPENSDVPSMPITAVFAEDFEDDLGSWFTNDEEGNATIEIVSDDQLPVSTETGHALKHTVTNDVYPYIANKTAFEVKPNTDYILTFSALGTNHGWPVKAIIGGNYWLGEVVYETETLTPSITKWTTYSYVFNSGNHTKLYMGLKSSWTNTTVYFDNVSVTRVFDDGHIRNGDFDTGSTMEWVANDGVDVEVDPTGFRYGYVMKTDIATSGATMFSQTAKNLQPNTDYKLRFLVNSYSTASQPAFWVQFPSDITDWSVNVGNTGLTHQSADANTPRINVYSANDALNKWHTVIITFNSGNNTEIPINFKNYRTSAGQYYFDDVIVYEAKDPSNDGYLINGDFEIGAEPVWELHAQSYIDIQSAYEGNFGAHLLLNNSASWGGVLNQTINNLKLGGAYRITFWYKSVQQGFNWKITGDAATLANGYISNKSWTKVSKTFVADSTSAVLNFSGSGIKSDNAAYEAGKDEMLVDCVLIEYLPDELVDVFDYNGKSAMEMNDKWTGEVAGKGGLAFMFTADMYNAQTNEPVEDYINGDLRGHGATYKDGTATAYPYSNDAIDPPHGYKVLKVGAIVSHSISTEADLTLDKVATLSSTIDIEGKKCWSLTDSTYQYAIRVINIPENHFDTEIYIRPYMLIETLDGNQEVIYGSMTHSNYNDTIQNRVPQPE